MSAEALNPRQFGPGGKYSTVPMDMWGKPATGDYARPTLMHAYHTESGRRIGSLSWFPALSEGEIARGGRHVQGSPDPSKPGIYKAYVSRPQRRKGVASAMLEHARDIAPGLQHSTALSEEGAAWAKARP